ncbi:MAG: hypothetical protein MI923_19150 [Phycisphaerales bacterium]|nr:hypothetical protein [Phycisphaerales bacterium]
MGDYTPYQKKVIERYYDRKEEIVIANLSELVTELYLADTEKKRDRLWDRVKTAMGHLKIKESIATHILTQRKPEILASHIKDWMKQFPAK